MTSLIEILHCSDLQAVQIFSKSNLLQPHMHTHSWSFMKIHTNPWVRDALFHVVKKELLTKRLQLQSQHHTQHTQLLPCIRENKMDNKLDSLKMKNLFKFDEEI